MRHSVWVKSFEENRTRFQDLYTHIKVQHETSPKQNHGHGLEHDAAVAQMATLIAPTERLAQMGWVAGLIHSTDRVAEADEYQAKLRACLAFFPQGFFTTQETEEIYLAVFEHDQKMPEHRSGVQEVLQDADKLVNMQASVIMRAGQHRPDLPVLEYCYLEERNPASTYKTPQSVLDNLEIMSSENPSLLFTEKGKELGAAYAKQLEEYRKQILSDSKQLGLLGVRL